MPLPTQMSQQSALKIIPNTPGIMNSQFMWLPPLDTY